EASEEQYVLGELAYLWGNEANYTSAITAASRSLSNAPDPAIALHLTRLQRLAGRPQDALATLAILDRASLPRALLLMCLDERAQLEAELGDKRRAFDALNGAIQIEPSGPRLYQRGIHQRDLGEFDEAFASFRGALGVEPTNTRVREALGYT